MKEMPNAGPGTEAPRMRGWVVLDGLTGDPNLGQVRSGDDAGCDVGRGPETRPAKARTCMGVQEQPRRAQNATETQELKNGHLGIARAGAWAGAQSASARPAASAATADYPKKNTLLSISF